MRARGIAGLVGAPALLAAACAQPPPAAPEPDRPPVEASSRVDKAVATTGDVITYEVIVEHDPRVEVRLPELGDQIAGFRIVDLGTDPPVERRGRVTRRRWYQLRADLVGSYVLPPVRVAYELPEGMEVKEPEPAAEGAQDASPAAAGAAPADPGTGAADEAAVDDATVDDAAPDDAKADGTAVDDTAVDDAAVDDAAVDDAAVDDAAVDDAAVDDAAADGTSGRDGSAAPPQANASARRGVLTTSEIFVEVASVLPTDGTATDIRDIKPLEPLPRPVPWPWIAAGGALLVAAALLVVWRRVRNRAVALPPTPPHEIAFAALDHLRQTDFDDPEAVRRYTFHLSEVIRTYVEGRFAINATDLTTDEILRALPELYELAPAARHKLEGFLVDTDRVKFAGHLPSAAEISGAYEAALSFVEETMPREPREGSPAASAAQEAA